MSDLINEFQKPLLDELKHPKKTELSQEEYRKKIAELRKELERKGIIRRTLNGPKERR